MFTAPPGVPPIEEATQKRCPECGEVFDVDVTFCPDDGAPLDLDRGQDPLVGRVFQGRFEVLERLGAGAMGAVYKARQVSVDRLVALKILKREMMDNRTLVKRFLLEARATSALTNAHTITIFDFGETADGLLFIAMEFLQGTTLRDKLDAVGTVPVVEMARIVDEMAESLAEAHSQEIVHRDLKPDNIFLTRTNTSEDFVKVLDFGIARARNYSENATITQHGTMAGTPPYMAPETITGDHVDARADIYGLGVMMYEMLAGRCPFEAASPIGVLMRHLQDEPPPIEAFNQDAVVPEPIYELIWRCLAKDSARRPRDAAELRRELAAAMEAARHAGYAPGSPGERTALGYQGADASYPTPMMGTHQPGVPTIEAVRQTVPAARDTRAALSTLTGEPTRSGGARRALLVGAAVVLLGAIAGVAAWSASGDDAAAGAAEPETAAAATSAKDEPPVKAESSAPGVDSAADDAARPALTTGAPDSAGHSGDVAPTAAAAGDSEALAPVPAPVPVVAPVVAAVVAAPEAPAQVAVTILSEPLGAEVFRDKELVGTTPALLKLEEGETAIDYTLRLAGHVDDVVEVVPDADKVVQRKLAPVPKVRSKPAVRPRRRPSPRPSKIDELLP